MASLAFDKIAVTYEGSDRQVRALDDISLAIDAGEPVAIIGPSGCGKSTMLLLAAGLLAPSAGRVVVDGVSPEGPRLQTALILQDLGLLPWKTVAENAALGLRIRHVAVAEERRRSGEALERVGLADFCGLIPRRALRRDAAASRAGPRARARRRPAADGRTALGARRPDPGRPSGRAVGAVARSAAHPSTGDALDRRGGVPRPQGRGAHATPGSRRRDRR